jgi:release factor glutamine methyltransferase
MFDPHEWLSLTTQRYYVGSTVKWNALVPFGSSLISEDMCSAFTLHLLTHSIIGLKVMLPTPSTSHINSDFIYEPAEDSFLLLDTLSSTSETLFLTERFRPEPILSDQNTSSTSPLILEVGTGSGVLLAFLAANAEALFGRRDIFTIGTDINPYACQATEQTVLKACRDDSRASEPSSGCSGAVPFLAALHADLATSIRPKMVDVLIFNPPYVPTPEVPKFRVDALEPEKIRNEPENNRFMNDSYLISLSYAGGTDGMHVTNRLLIELPDIISSVRGVAYILLCKQNKPDEVVERVRRWGPEWSATIVGQSGKTGGWEKLQVLRICRV